MDKLINKVSLFILGLIILTIQLFYVTTYTIGRNDFYIVNRFTGHVTLVTPSGKIPINELDPDQLATQLNQNHSH